MPTQGSASSIYGTTDDHDGWGVASGFDPSGGEPMYQAGHLWVSLHAFSTSPGRTKGHRLSVLSWLCLEIVGLNIVYCATSRLSRMAAAVIFREDLCG